MYPKQYYDYYVSAPVHTRKLKIPKQIKRLLFIIALIFAVCGYSLYSCGGFKTFMVDDSPPVNEVAETPVLQQSVVSDTANIIEEEQEIDLSKPYGWAALPPVPAVRGCVANKRKNWCQCFGENNTPIQMEHAQCLSVLAKPLPFATSLNYSGTK